MREKLRRVKFVVSAEGVDSLIEFLCRLMPGDAVTAEWIDDEETAAKVTCWMTADEIEYMRGCMPELADEDALIGEAVEKLLTELEESS